MKKVIGVLAFSTALLGSTALSGSVAFAGQNDDLVSRLNAAEQENAAMRRKSAELATAATKPVGFADKMADFSGAYAADLPVAYKARPPVEPGRFTVWVEGGAIWTGGDEVARAFSLTDFTTRNSSLTLIAPNRPIPGIFDLNPKVGWEAATGFDYKFANSPWLVSGQFRYGEGGKTSRSASSSGTIDPFILMTSEGACGDFSFPLTRVATGCGGSETFSASYKEKHWLADLALGYDIAGHGPAALQLKGGLRVSEFVATTNTSDQFSSFINFPPGTATFGNPGIPVSAVTYTALTTENIRNNFLGAGPLIGLAGSVRFAGTWSFDYKGDLAVLFGTQKSLEISKTVTTLTPAFLGLSNMTPGYNHVYTESEARFATMLSGDIQAGFSYWFNPNLKLGLSYRIDALIAVKNQKSANANDLLLPQRYWHGPRVSLTGQFSAN